MLKCWEEQPTDRPTFNKLRKTMKEMEKKHKVTEFTFGNKVFSIYEWRPIFDNRKASVVKTLSGFHGIHGRIEKLHTQMIWPIMKNKIET